MDSQVVNVSRSKIENIGALPTIPGTLKMVSAIIEKPRVTLEEIGRFVSNDPALTTRVLKMVNSAAFGFRGRISSVPHAIMLLGINVVKGLLLGISVFEIMEKVMKGLWKHSLGCAVAARAIAEKKGLNDQEEIYAAGLLHDLGKVLLILLFQQQYEAAMNEVTAKNITIAEAETQFFSDTHPAVGMWLAEKWHFPGNLVEVIAFHHSPARAKLAPLETAIVHLSDILVRSRGIGFPGDPFVPAVSPAAFELLDLSGEDMKDVLARVEESVETADDLAQE
ncbi:MAG: HDOD domain-containing protein [Smithellaceae bacterium]|nr:HDOD domain-containing protein [Smithellaceae bacterium]